MTRIYFVRHAQSDKYWKEDRTRPLTEEGLKDSKKVTGFFRNKKIDYIYASPYQRTIDTVKDLANSLHKEIQPEEDFRERFAGAWIEGDFKEFIKKQWKDFDYHLDGGESLKKVQERNIGTLKRLLKVHKEETLVIATHGTALSTILNYFNAEYDYRFMMKIINFMPYIIRLDFDVDRCVAIKEEFIVEKEY